MQHDSQNVEPNNKVVLTGTITQLTKENNEQTEDFLLAVGRLSGMYDFIPVSAVDRKLLEPLAEGQTVTVTGQFISFNKIVAERSKLILMVRADEIIGVEEVDTHNPNNITLVGFVCKTPVYRTTPFNREIADLLLAVNRSANKSDYIPAIAWGRNARLAKNLLVGEKVRINGRVQSREYQKRLNDDSIETRVAYEVSINAVERVV